MMRKRAITGTDHEDKIPIAKALGQIGSPEALQELNNVLTAKTFLFKGSREKLHKEIRSILKKYSQHPSHDTRDVRGSSASLEAQ
jgi:hypothetical protein